MIMELTLKSVSRGPAKSSALSNADFDQKHHKTIQKMKDSTAPLKIGSWL